jgi:predicted ArsR family transcriptional regulator
VNERSHHEHVYPSVSAISAIASISDPIRRSLFDLVSRSDAPIGRDDAAAALSIPRATAAFHLERLAESGMLATEFSRRSGRTGPGAGRPAKLYRRAHAEIAVSIPERHYDLAGELLSSAIEESDRTGEPIRGVLTRVSTEHGRAIGERSESLAAVLESTGYEPVDNGDGSVQLANCPFQRLAANHGEIICGANVALLKGVAEGAGDDPDRVCFAPREGHCCVRIAP